MPEPGDYFSLRTLGTTGLRVTPLCIGTAALGDMPETFAYSVAEEDALAAVRETLESSINFIDTAASYGDGESERRIGIVLREHGGIPDGDVVGTKADRDLTTGDFSGAQMRRSVERSLDLLGLDRLQLVHLHDPEHSTFDAITAPGGPLEVLLDLKDEGLIQHLGVAGGPIDQEIRYVETGCFEVVVTHNRYTLLNRSAEPLLEIAAMRNVAVLNAAPYGSGILSRGPESYPRYAYQAASNRDGGARAATTGHLRQVRDSAGRGRAAVFAEGPAHRLDHRRRKSAGPHRENTRTGRVRNTR